MQPRKDTPFGPLFLGVNVGFGVSNPKFQIWKVGWIHPSPSDTGTGRLCQKCIGRLAAFVVMFQPWSPKLYQRSSTNVHSIALIILVVWPMHIRKPNKQTNKQTNKNPESPQPPKPMFFRQSRVSKGSEDNMVQLIAVLSNKHFRVSNNLPDCC